MRGDAPLGALVRADGGWAVFRIADGRARLTPVAVGAMTDREAEILAGGAAITNGEPAAEAPPAEEPVAEAPAGAWETEILPARVAEYEPAWLDDRCSAGRLMWARLKPRTVRSNGGEARPAHRYRSTIFQ